MRCQQASGLEISQSDPIAQYAPAIRVVSTTGTPLGQRARSSGTPSGNRLRVGPPRSSASSSAVLRSKTVALMIGWITAVRPSRRPPLFPFSPLAGEGRGEGGLLG